MITVSKNNGSHEINPSFSIILTCYNREKFIKEAISSCCKQDYSGEWEIIIVDDCSTDQSQTIIEKTISEHPESPIRYIARKKNGGVAAATDTAVLAAQYEWMVIADGDDVQLPNRLSIAAEIIRKHTDILYLTMSLNAMSANGTITGQQHYLSHTSTADTPNELILTTGSERYMNIAHGTPGLVSRGAAAIFHRSIYDIFGILQKGSDKHLEQDAILFFRASLIGPVMGSKAIVCNYRYHSGNLSNIVLSMGIRGTMDYERHQDKYHELHANSIEGKLRDIEYVQNHEGVSDWNPEQLAQAQMRLQRAAAFSRARAGWWARPWRERLLFCIHEKSFKSLLLRLLPFNVFCALKHMLKVIKNR